MVIHLPEERELDMGNADDLLSHYLGRRVRPVAQAYGEKEFQACWPRIVEFTHMSEYVVGKTLSGTFFDCAPIHPVNSSANIHW